MMNTILMFLLNSVLLGVGLAMDAFSVSLANGLNEPKMRFGRMCGIAGVFAFFQALMPMIGWVCVHTVAQRFKAFERIIPWIALILLAFIGGKMLIEGLSGKSGVDEPKQVGFPSLLVQGIATSIDALSVGFTISEYNLYRALACAAVIAAVTFLICICGVQTGKKFGAGLSGKAAVFGGVILILIGIEIFVTAVI
ncbi:MAG: manganese efflux pump MntP family protein [Acutalibacteraceae bacterium]